MSTMIITTDNMTTRRMAVIAKRTQSTLMVGAKAMMVENLKTQMKNEVAHFAYLKKDGTVREAWGTTCGTLVAKYTNDAV